MLTQILNASRALGSALVIATLLGVMAPKAHAAGDEFEISVHHGINGRSLGLSKALPVEATVELDGQVIAVLPLEFGDTFNATLPAGTYRITVQSLELGVQLETMTVGPAEIPGGVSVDLHAKLSAKKTPIIKARVK